MSPPRRTRPRSRVRPHKFIPDEAAVDARGRSTSCAICTLGPTNVCHPQKTEATIPTVSTTVQALEAALNARILGEHDQE